MEPRNLSHSREPTSSTRRKAASRRRNGLALAIPPGSESRARSRGSPRNLGGPRLSSGGTGDAESRLSSPALGLWRVHGPGGEEQARAPEVGRWQGKTGAAAEGDEGVGGLHKSEDAGEQNGNWTRPSKGGPC
jgi:hypothetical protein